MFSWVIDVGPTDLLFVDTWHVYAQLKRELDTHGHHVRKYIVLHDTTLDGDKGTSVRKGWDTSYQARETGESPSADVIVPNASGMQAFQRVKSVREFGLLFKNSWL